jgi:hypothetical protein
MKLYTADQVRNAIAMGYDWCHQKHIPSDDMIDTFIEQLTPIELPSDSLCINCDESESTHNICMDCIIKIGKENIQLPSDEEIEEKAKKVGGGHYPFICGAKWVINKIQGGNNEQQ